MFIDILLVKIICRLKIFVGFRTAETSVTGVKLVIVRGVEGVDHVIIDSIGICFFYAFLSRDDDNPRIVN